MNENLTSTAEINYKPTVKTKPATESIESDASNASAETIEENIPIAASTAIDIATVTDDLLSSQSEDTQEIIPISLSVSRKEIEKFLNDWHREAVGENKNCCFYIRTGIITSLFVTLIGGASALPEMLTTFGQSTVIVVFSGITEIVESVVFYREFNETVVPTFKKSRSPQVQTSCPVKIAKGALAIIFSSAPALVGASVVYNSSKQASINDTVTTMLTCASFLGNFILCLIPSVDITNSLGKMSSKLAELMNNNFFHFSYLEYNDKEKQNHIDQLQQSLNKRLQAIKQQISLSEINQNQRRIKKDWKTILPVAKHVRFVEEKEPSFLVTISAKCLKGIMITTAIACTAGSQLAWFCDTNHSVKEFTNSPQSYWPTWLISLSMQTTAVVTTYLVTHSLLENAAKSLEDKIVGRYQPSLEMHVLGKWVYSIPLIVLLLVWASGYADQDIIDDYFKEAFNLNTTAWNNSSITPDDDSSLFYVGSFAFFSSVFTHFIEFLPLILMLSCCYVVPLGSKLFTCWMQAANKLEVGKYIDEFEEAAESLTIDGYLAMLKHLNEECSIFPDDSEESDILSLYMFKADHENEITETTALITDSQGQGLSNRSYGTSFFTENRDRSVSISSEANDENISVRIEDEDNNETTNLISYAYC